MDKEIANIQEIQKYIGTKVGIKHLSNSYSLFNSGVIYEDPKHGDLILENVQMRWQHSFNNDISIAELRPPY